MIFKRKESEMTVAELKAKCEEAIADGYEDCEVILCTNDACEEEDFTPLDKGFSSVVYNGKAEDAIKGLEDYDFDPDNCIILN